MGNKEPILIETVTQRAFRKDPLLHVAGLLIAAGLIFSVFIVGIPVLAMGIILLGVWAVKKLLKIKICK